MALKTMRLLRALKTLETATLECTQRSIDTAEVRGALDAVEPYIKFNWYVRNFRLYVCRGSKELSRQLELQQRLALNFRGIHSSIRALLHNKIGKLGRRYARTKDATTKMEIDRLSAELAKLPERWNCDAGDGTRSRTKKTASEPRVAEGHGRRARVFQHPARTDP
jgi:hypothetical protein